MDNDFVLSTCKDNSIDFVIVGPEAPLTNGVADILQNENIHVFGPDSKAAELEGSKIFMKDLCKKYEIPSACLLYTSPSPRDKRHSRMPSSD